MEVVTLGLGLGVGGRECGLWELVIMPSPLLGPYYIQFIISVSD
jgi:hypothetical protein